MGGGSPHLNVLLLIAGWLVLDRGCPVYGARTLFFAWISNAVTSALMMVVSAARHQSEGVLPFDV